MTDFTKVASEYVARKAGRRDFLVRIGSAGLGVAAGTFIAGCGGGSNSGPANAQNGGLAIGAAEIARAFQDIQTDENDHVTFLINALGSSARPRPQFNPSRLTAPDINTFIRDSAALENTGTGAYPYVLTNPNFASNLADAQAAGTIAIVEGRHAGFLNALNGQNLLTDPNMNDTGSPSNGSREVIQPPSQVVSRAAPFLGTVSLGSPGTGTTADTYLMGYTYNPDGGLTGAGSPVPADSVGGPTANSTVSLVGILNYALLLEYLERDFYNINVPKYFGGSGPTYHQTGAV